MFTPGCTSYDKNDTEYLDFVLLQLLKMLSLPKLSADSIQLQLGLVLSQNDDLKNHIMINIVALVRSKNKKKTVFCILFCIPPFDIKYP